MSIRTTSALLYETAVSPLEFGVSAQGNLTVGSLLLDGYETLFKPQKIQSYDAMGTHMRVAFAVRQRRKARHKSIEFPHGSFRPQSLTSLESVNETTSRTQRTAHLNRTPWARERLRCGSAFGCSSELTAKIGINQRSSLLRISRGRRGEADYA